MRDRGIETKRIRVLVRAGRTATLSIGPGPGANRLRNRVSVVGAYVAQCMDCANRADWERATQSPQGGLSHGWGGGEGHAESSRRLSRGENKAVDPGMYTWDCYSGGSACTNDATSRTG